MTETTINIGKLKYRGKYVQIPIKIGALQRSIILQLYNIAKTKPTSRIYPHAASYSAIAFPYLKVKSHTAPAISRAIKSLVDHELIGRTTVSANGKLPYTFPLYGAKKKVKPALLNQYIIKQEIIYLTKLGASLLED